MGPAGASCVNLLTDGNRDISPEVWDRLEVGPDHRFGKLCTSSDSFTDMKKSIMKMCKICKCCTYEFKKKVNEFHEKVQSLELKLKEDGTYDTL